MNSLRLDTCALCPRLCRPACPVASGSAREAAVPSVIAGVLLDWQRGLGDAALAAKAATLCVDCGACQAHCHLDRPLPAALRFARVELVPVPPFEALRPIEGRGRMVAIEADERPLAKALARRLAEPIRRWPTADRLGVAAIDYPAFENRLAEVRATLADCEVVVVDGAVAEVLKRAGVSFRWLHEVVPDLAAPCGSCRTAGPKPAACCGAAGPLAQHHPEDAVRVGRHWLARTEERRVNDARCRNHLVAIDASVRDALDLLLEST